MTTEASEAAANEQAFSAGFEKVTPPAAAPTPAPAAVEQPAAQPAAVPAPVKDEWEGVQPKVRQTLESISGRLGSLDKIDHRLKGVEGRVGALYQARKAADDVQKAGGAAPTEQQIQTASTSGEKWNALLESFPDFKDGLEERFAQIDAALKQQKPFDADGLKSDLQGFVSASTRELREFAKLDSKHDGWEDTINTPQFAEWAFSNGPTPTDQAQWKLLKSDSPDKAEEFFKQFEQRYPQWWKERGSHMASSNAKDAIALLDGFQAHNTAVSDRKKQQDKSAQRLGAAITPTGAGAPPGQPEPDEEAAFAKGFKKVAGR